nr:PREDICTED: rho GTPase-activating protein 30 [Lepisosteus oculatus]XP_015194595.1 PREDICTED: rho GTPase-activating protein 30 [Lepisosteus oculatus]
MRRGRRKGQAKEKVVFGCDLVDHTTNTNQEIPQVLRSCTEFVEEHGIVDGIYRLSGISSNIQKLRNEFDSQKEPDLNKEVYLQDIHCVSSLCKAYFRELPNPLLTYQLYDKFADAIAVQLEEERLVKIKEVLEELPIPHYRTLEFLMRHLVRMASHAPQTNMHSRNLAIVWAPNLLRSKDIETTGFNGTAAFMEVRIQSIVVEFILMHVEQLFEEDPKTEPQNKRRKSLPISPSLQSDESFFRALPFNVPNSISPGDGPLPMRPYHAIIEVSENKRKGSLKGRKWKSIFNLGRSSNETKKKGKSNSKEKEKVNLRPAKSMDSLSSVPYVQDVPMSNRSSSEMLGQECFGSGESPTLGPSAAPSVVPVAEGLMGGSSYAVTYRRGGGASVSVLSGAYGKAESGPSSLGSYSITETGPSKSPKVHGNRAEKRAGIHISGPFSVTVPLHITSGLAMGVLQGVNVDAGDRKADKMETREEAKDPECQPQHRDGMTEGKVPEKNVDDTPQPDTMETGHSAGDSLGSESESGDKDHGNSEQSSVSSEEEEEDQDADYMDMRRDIGYGCPHDFSLELQDTFGFLDLIDRNDTVEEFSVEPPCYEDDDACQSFSSEMYEPPSSLSPESTDFRGIPPENDNDDDDDEEFHSVPDHLDLTELRPSEPLPTADSRRSSQDNQVTETARTIGEDEKETTEPDQSLTRLSDDRANEAKLPPTGALQESLEIIEDLQTAPADTSPPPESEQNYLVTSISENAGQTENELQLEPKVEERIEAEPDGGCKKENHVMTGESGRILEDIPMNPEPLDDTLESAVAPLHKDSVLHCAGDVVELRITEDSYTLECTEFRYSESCVQNACVKSGTVNIENDRIQCLGIQQSMGVSCTNDPQGNETHFVPGSSHETTSGPQLEQDFDTGLQNHPACASEVLEVLTGVLNAIDQQPDSASSASSEVPATVKLAEEATVCTENQGKFEATCDVNELDAKTDTKGHLEPVQNAPAPDPEGDKPSSLLALDDGNLKPDKDEELSKEVTNEETEGLEATSDSGAGSNSAAGPDNEVAGSAEMRDDVQEEPCPHLTKGEEEEVHPGQTEPGMEGSEQGEIEPALFDDEGGARMKLAISGNALPRVYQVKSVPVVPPKPQFSKLPPALKMKHQLFHHQEAKPKEGEQEGERGGDDGGRERNSSPAGGGETGKDSDSEGDKGGGGRIGHNVPASISFDEAWARAMDRHPNKVPVRRIQTCGDSSPTASPSVPKLARHAYSDITGQAVQSGAAAAAVAKRKSFPHMKLACMETEDERKRRSLMMESRSGGGD